jgi:hypothetical protein
MRPLQGSFSRLKLPLPALDHKSRRDIILLAVRLHQVWCQSVVINQTSAVYQDVEDKFQLLGRQFHNMFFQRLHDVAVLVVITMVGFNATDPLFYFALLISFYINLLTKCKAR